MAGAVAVIAERFDDQGGAVVAGIAADAGEALALRTDGRSRLDAAGGGGGRGAARTRFVVLVGNEVRPSTKPLGSGCRIDVAGHYIGP